MTKADRDNHANQLNPNNDTYWQSRGYEERPDDWKERSDREGEATEDKDVQGKA